MVIFILISGLLSSCRKRTIVISDSDSGIVFVSEYKIPQEVSDSVFNYYLWIGLEPDANRDSIKSVWNKSIYNSKNIGNIVRASYHYGVPADLLTQEQFNNYMNY